MPEIGYFCTFKAVIFNVYVKYMAQSLDFVAKVNLHINFRKSEQLTAQEHPTVWNICPASDSAMRRFRLVVINTDSSLYKSGKTVQSARTLPNQIDIEIIKHVGQPAQMHLRR